MHTRDPGAGIPVLFRVHPPTVSLQSHPVIVVIAFEIPGTGQLRVNLPACPGQLTARPRTTIKPTGGKIPV
jgi:hypothetical protein